MAAAPGDFRAWIEGTATLHVEGTVTLPTPGHTAALVPVADRAARDADTLRLRLDVDPPEGLVAQVLTDARVAWSGPAGRPYTTVSVDGVAVAIPVETGG
jgi:hypothetical protein